jgi:16S rRNA (uracil1498-N3)-methyltransferase
VTAPVFVVPHDRATAARAGGKVALDGGEGRHAVVVRRIRPGELLHLSDGVGTLLHTRVIDASSDSLVCEVLQRVNVPPPSPSVVLVQALAKGDRSELAVEACTEVGVDRIVPWSATRSIVQWRGERGDRALRRWRSTAHEAAKQSRRAWFPVVEKLSSTAGVAARLSAATLGLVLHEESAAVPIGSIDPPDSGDVVLVVGPEGGITAEELAAFRAAGAVFVRLGPTVLRTSTAGAVAAGVVLSRTARWA